MHSVALGVSPGWYCTWLSTHHRPFRCMQTKCPSCNHLRSCRLVHIMSLMHAAARSMTGGEATKAGRGHRPRCEGPLEPAATSKLGVPLVSATVLVCTIKSSPVSVRILTVTCRETGRDTTLGDQQQAIISETSGCLVYLSIYLPGPHKCTCPSNHASMAAGPQHLWSSCRLRLPPLIACM
jgi:hypothetical protein